MDAGGTSDPYVRVWVNPDKKKAFCTKKLKKTLNPVYNETFTFLKLPFNEMDGKVLIMAIYDHDALGSDDQIGKCRGQICTSFRLYEIFVKIKRLIM